MAIITKDSLLANVRGRIGGFVVKQYGNKIVLSSPPDMSNVKPTQLQQERRKKFGAAVQYAKAILQDPKKKKMYERKLKKGEKVFQYAIREFMEKGEEHES